MAVPFSNTSLRVPRGFGNILEGLAREVLRDQPADIPSFAAGYFTALLQKREESGLDPAEWGAQLEDRFYNNNAFRASSSVEESETHLNSFRNNEDKTSPSPQISSPSFKTLDASNDNVEPQSDMLEMKPDDDSGEFSYSGTAGADICAQELSTEEQTPRNEERFRYSEEENDTAGNEICASGRTDVDVHDEELQSGSTVEEHNEVSEGPNPFQVEDESRGVPDKDEEFISPGEVLAADKDEEFISPGEVLAADKDEEFISPGEVLAADKDDEFISPGEVLAADKDEEFISPGEVLAADKDDALEPHGTDETESETNKVESNEPAEINDQSVSESFDVTSTEEALGVKGVKDVLTETEDINKSSNCDDADAETDNNAIHEDQEEILDKPTDPRDPDGPTETREGHQRDDTRTSQDAAGFNDTLETFGSLTEAEMKEDRVPTQVPRRASKDLASSPHRPRSEESDEEDTDLKDNTDSGGASRVPTAYDTEEDTEATYEECTAVLDYVESGPREDIRHDGMLGNQDEELEQQEDSSQPQEEEDIMDIPLDDPEANKAAAKIQAGFRGHMTRKKLKPDEKPGEEPEDQKTDDTSVPEQ